MGAVGEGDFLNALVLQIAQRPEGAGEDCAVGTGCHGQNAVRGFRLIGKILAFQIGHAVQGFSRCGFFRSGFLRFNRRLYRAGDGFQNGSIAGFPLHLAGGVQPGGVRYYLTAVNLITCVGVISTAADGRTVTS